MLDKHNVNKVNYSVDIVFCIDTTSGMQPIIFLLKQEFVKLYDSIWHAMKQKSRRVDEIRVKIINYRDFITDGEYALNESDFFILPNDRNGFVEYVNSLEAHGGGNEPSNGLEALDIAIRSNWTNVKGKKRQIIVIFTDSSCHSLELAASKKLYNYPENIALNFVELTNRWEDDDYVDFSSKRLIIFAPDAYPWTDIGNSWSNVVISPSKDGLGLKEIKFDWIIESISNSV